MEKPTDIKGNELHVGDRVRLCAWKYEELASITAIIGDNVYLQFRGGEMEVHNSYLRIQTKLRRA